MPLSPLLLQVPNLGFGRTEASSDRDLQDLRYHVRSELVKLNRKPFLTALVVVNAMLLIAVPVYLVAAPVSQTLLEEANITQNAPVSAVSTRALLQSVVDAINDNDSRITALENANGVLVRYDFTWDPPIIPAGGQAFLSSHQIPMMHSTCRPIGLALPDSEVQEYLFMGKGRESDVNPDPYSLIWRQRMPSGPQDFVRLFAWNQSGSDVDHSPVTVGVWLACPR